MPASSTIVRVVSKLDRNRTPQQVISSLPDPDPLVDEKAVVSMPSGGVCVDEKITVEFFKLDRVVSDDELQTEYEKRGLTSDPYAQAAVNEADPLFCEDYPNGTHWKDEDGWCFMTFSPCNPIGCGVLVDRCNDNWDDDWWFAGVSKK